MVIAQISDPHVTLPREGPSNSDSLVHLQRAVEHLTRLPVRPDVVLVTGDCVDDGHPDEYALFQKLVRPLPMPVYVVPGNHDDRAETLRTFGTQGAPLSPRC